MSAFKINGSSIIDVSRNSISPIPDICGNPMTSIQKWNGPRWSVQQITSVWSSYDCCVSEDRSHISTLNETVMLIFLFTFEKPPFLLKLGIRHSVLRNTFVRSWIKLEISFLKVVIYSWTALYFYSLSQKVGKSLNPRPRILTLGTLIKVRISRLSCVISLIKTASEWIYCILPLCFSRWDSVRPTWQLLLLLLFLLQDTKLFLIVFFSCHTLFLLLLISDIDTLLPLFCLMMYMSKQTTFQSSLWMNGGGCKPAAVNLWNIEIPNFWVWAQWQLSN